jgi:hypothetical protein
MPTDKQRPSYIWDGLFYRSLLMSDQIEIATGISGKKLTQTAMILASVWIIGNTLAKGILLIFGMQYLEMIDILTSGFAIAGVFAPFYISIILDKLKEIKQVVK